MNQTISFIENTSILFQIDVENEHIGADFICLPGDDDYDDFYDNEEE